MELVDGVSPSRTDAKLSEDLARLQDLVVRQEQQKHIESYYAGVLDGLRRGAWWREGEQYVGAQDKPAPLSMVVEKLAQEKARKLGEVV